MRKVKVFEEKRIMVEGVMKRERVLVGEALFHQWVVEGDDDGSTAMAIVEFPDGHCDTVWVRHIEFIEPDGLEKLKTEALNIAWEKHNPKLGEK